MRTGDCDCPISTFFKAYILEVGGFELATKLEVFGTWLELCALYLWLPNFGIHQSLGVKGGGTKRLIKLATWL